MTMLVDYAISGRALRPVLEPLSRMLEGDDEEPT